MTFKIIFISGISTSFLLCFKSTHTIRQMRWSLQLLRLAMQCTSRKYIGAVFVVVCCMLFLFVFVVVCCCMLLLFVVVVAVVL